MLSSHLRLGLPSGLLPSGFPRGSGVLWYTISEFAWRYWRKTQVMRQPVSRSEFKREIPDCQAGMPTITQPSAANARSVIRSCGNATSWNPPNNRTAMLRYYYYYYSAAALHSNVPPVLVVWRHTTSHTGAFASDRHFQSLEMAEVRYVCAKSQKMLTFIICCNIPFLWSYS
jgi:hypothetical protein